MDFALAYLVGRLFFRLFDFFHHWYIDSSRHFGSWALGAFERLDQTFAVKITLEHFFEPLYKDYSMPGRFFGIVFRTGRASVGLVIYLVLAALFGVLYLTWLAIPPFILWNAWRNL